jgi:hypothetical protein
MSADNFVVVRRRADGYYWGNFSASYWWGRDEPYPDSSFVNGPFATEEAAENDADASLGIIEYGFEKDRTC